MESRNLEKLGARISKIQDVIGEVRKIKKPAKKASKEAALLLKTLEQKRTGKEKVQLERTQKAAEGQIPRKEPPTIRNNPSFSR